MASSTTPSSRKRGRPRNDELELEVNSPTKKPRLNSSAASKRTTPGSLRSLSSAISSSFGCGARKVSTNGVIEKGRQPIDKIYEIPDSDNEGERSKNGQSDGTPKASARQPTQNLDGVYDFRGSDEEPSPVHTPSRRNRGVGLPSKTSSRAAKSTPTAVKTKIKGNLEASSQRQTRGARSAAPETDSGAADGQAHGATASETLDDESKDESSSEGILTPSAGRSRSQNGGAFNKTNGDTPRLKGILTPSRRLCERNTKSVAFDEPKAKADEMYFADLPNKPVKSKKLSPKRPAGKENQLVKKANEGEDIEEEHVEGDDDDDDDEVCAVCSKPDSKPPNEILFCDSCDMAVHQKCYGVAKIPKGDWLCKDCAQDPSGGSGVAGKKTPVVAAEVKPDIPNFEAHLRSQQRVLLDRCTGKRRIKLRGQDEAYEKTFQLVEQTVLAGEGNSMLIIGARGCGKTTMVDSVLSDMSREHINEFHVVRLNGFVHTDDKLALKDIWRQLGKEMEVEDDLIGKTNNYADTLASLLALLSHPSEIAEAQEGVTSKSVVFIIDEFDLFATHARQTLLYNLFDIAQARKAPIAVLGLTNRIDVVESLEKRVKSRFSHRYVYLSLPKNMSAYWDICKQGLMVEDEEAKAEGLGISLPGFAKFQDYWAKNIDSLFTDPAFKDHIEYHYYSTKSVPAFLGSCILPLANLSPANLSLGAIAASAAGQGVDPPLDSKLHLLASLSDLDLSLLIAAARLDIVAHTDTVNFAMAYDEYTTLMGRQRVQSSVSGMLAVGGGAGRVWGRGVAEMAWERLVALGLLLPTGAGGAGGARHGGGVGARMWKVDVTLEEIPAAVKLGAILARWCREI